MASEATHLLAEYLHQLSSAARVENMPDRALLERFVNQRDEDAFAALVRRHGPMVLRVCQRILHDAHAAEDAFQATFLVLSRKAASLRCAESVGCWLHGVAFRLAQNARKQLIRRQKHESQAAVEKYADDPLAELRVREAQAILDEELGRLPEKYRAALVLCCLEGKTRDEAARQLGWPAKLVKSRLEQGRERLHQRLTRRGLTLPAALGAALLTEEAAPAVLPATVVRAAVQTALASSGNGVSAPVALLAQNALANTAIGKAKVVIVGLLLLTGALAAGMGAFAPPRSPEKQTETPAVAKAKVSEPAKSEKPKPARILRVVVLDPQGKPLPDAKIHSSIWTHEKGFKSNHDYQTDANGVAQVELPKSFYILRLWASKKSFADLFAGWEQNELGSGEKMPAEYVFRMERAVTAGGRIVDEQGKPIAGAKVEVRLGQDRKPAHSDGRVSYNWALADRSNTTDAEGRWRIDNVPNHPKVELRLIISHPDYISGTGRDETQKASGVTTEMLLKGTAVLTLKRGVIVRGRVTDPAGKPIKDALVIYGDDSYSTWLPCKFPTDSEGRYRLPALPPGETTLTVIAHGWAPQLRKVNLQRGMPPQDFRIAAGKPIRLRIVDAADKPVPNAYVSILGWRGCKSLQSGHNPNHPKVPDPKFPRRTNANGVWEWTWAPTDPVKLSIDLQGFARQELEIAGGAAERTIVLKTNRIIGRVTDAVTGKPIPAFTIVPLDVFRKDFIHANRSHAVAGKNGRLEYLADRTDIPLQLRIEAPGYRTQDGPEFRVGDDSSRKQDFRLQPSEPITGVVHDSTGKPVAKAAVLLATPTEDAWFQPGGRRNHETSTVSGGHFAFPDPGEPFAVIAQAESGFALAEFAAGQHNAGTLRLRPWASIRGQFHDGGKPVRGATIFVNPIRIDTLDRPRIHAGAGLQTTTGADGRFEFARVPPVPVSVSVMLGPWKDEGFRSGPSLPLDLKPGQRADLDLGGDATIVTGKVKLTGKVPPDLDCTYSLNYLVERKPGIDPPPEIARLGFDARKGWRDGWTKTPEGLAYLSTLRHCFVKLAPDGTFRISGVPAGDYDLAIAVYAKPRDGC